MLWFFLLIRIAIQSLNTLSFSRTRMLQFKLGITSKTVRIRSLKKNRSRYFPTNQGLKISTCVGHEGI